MNLWDVHAYDSNTHQLLLAGQIEARNRNEATLALYKQLRKIYPEGVPCYMIASRRWA